MNHVSNLMSVMRSIGSASFLPFISPSSAALLYLHSIHNIWSSVSSKRGHNQLCSENRWNSVSSEQCNV